MLNQSYDENCDKDAVLYPDDDGRFYMNMKANEVATLFCRMNLVPQWIDVSVAFVHDEATHLSLTCCGRYYIECSLLYYYERGTQPFGIKCPVLPSTRSERDNLFNLPSQETYYNIQQKRRARMQSGTIDQTS